MTRLMTKFGRATRTRAFTAMLAIIGVTAVMASVKTARAFDQQASDATDDAAANWRAAGQGHVVAPRPGGYASAPRDRRVESAPAPRKDFQDIK